MSIKFLVLTITCILWGCTQEDKVECPGKFPAGRDITATLFENGCALNKLTEVDEVTFTISSQDEFDEWLACESDLPPVDFDEEYIIGGRIKSYECGVMKQLTLTEGCGKITVTVQIQAQICAAITEVYFFAAIPIEYVDNEVDFVFLAGHDVPQ